MNNKLKINITANTNGVGLWSKHKTSVDVKELELHYLSRNPEKKEVYRGELRAVFSIKTWDTYKHGLIYTDRGWIKDFRQKLIQNGFSKKAAKAVDYSEQGMQGDNYVSLDAGSDFIKEFAILKTFGEVKEY
jgi:hypothetical protein